MAQEYIMASQTFWLVIGLISLLVPTISSDRRNVEKSGVYMREKRFLRVIEDDGTLPEDVNEDSEGDDVKNSDFTTHMGDDEDNEEEDEGNSSTMDRLRVNSPLNGHGGALVDQAITSDINPDSEIAHLLEGMWVEHNGKEVHPNVDVSKSDKNLGNLHDSHILTHHQKVLYGLESEFPDEQKTKRRKKRNFLPGNDYLWTQGIVPYTIADSLSSGSAQMIETAVAMMSNLTCVRFTPRFSSLASTTVGNDNYVVFQNGGNCASNVGRRGGSQSITLYEPYCISIDTIIHEMCHALGQLHEQSRTDRDNYVELLWNNIQGGQSNKNMRKGNTRDNHPYDLESVMQYGLGAFAINNSRPTIRVLDPKLAFLADAATGLMYYDVRDITTVYQCTSSYSNSPNCQNGGFLNHRCRCYCPSGLTGSDCSQIQTDNNCGGIIDLASGESRTITSPNYPSNYNVNAVCNWLIRAPTGMKVQMDIDYMELSDNGQACYHWLEVRYNLMGQRGPELCGSRRGEVYITTSDELPSHMMLKFNSIFASDRPAQKGFILTVKPVGIVSCTFEDEEACFLTNMASNGTRQAALLTGDTFDWTMNHQGRTPSYRTGPNSASQGNKFAFIEASRPQRTNDRAVLQSSVAFDDNTRHCLTFDYHMYGTSVGKLNIYTTSSGGVTAKIFEDNGNHGNVWMDAALEIPPVQGLHVYVEAIRGGSWSGDIALDNVIIKTGPCGCLSSPCQNGGSCTSASNTNGFTCACTMEYSGETCSTVVASVKCTFTSGESCFLWQSKNDDYNWSFGTMTPSPHTGPQSTIDGTFAYTEASMRRRVGRYVLTTDLGNEDWCLSFDYYMYGSEMGDLVVHSGVSGSTSEQWRMMGNQGMQWLRANISIPAAQNLVVEIEGIRGSGFTGDIAVDNVKLDPGTC